MLNQDLYSHLRATGRLAPRHVSRVNPDMANSDWRAGEAPVRWDVPFTDKLMVGLRRFFARRQDVPEQGAIHLSVKPRS